MKKLIYSLNILLVSLVVFFVFRQNIFAQTPTPVSDATEDVMVECVTFTPTNGFGGLPNSTEPGTFTGTCSSTKKCDIMTCLPDAGCVKNAGFVKLDSGNDFFSPGEINETGQLVGVRDHTGYYLYAAHTPEPVGKGVEEENTTQQQAQVALVFPAGAENCTQIYWDPYGRVFDSVSLEPFGTGDAMVTLLDENGKLSLNTLTNNVLTDNMGKYNILVNKDGKYKLNVTPKTNHLFTSGMPDSRYTSLYEFIYKLGDPAFDEIAASPKRVDVALKPVGTPYTRSPDYISREYIDVLYEGETYTKIALRTVHPKTIVKVMINGVEVTEDGTGRALSKTSDKEGYWLALIKKTVFSQEGFTIELIKNPQYYPLAKNTTNYFSQLMDKLSSLFIKKVSAQQSIRINDPADPTPKTSDNSTTVIKFEPILEYIEGYAYDDGKKAIPNAKVSVKLKMNDKVFSSTTADEAGFFVMYPKDLPPYEFYLESVDPKTNKISVQTTSEFVEKNQTYLDTEKIDLIHATKQDQKIVNSETGELNKIVKNNNPSQQNNQAQAAAKNIAFDPAVLIVGLIILLVVVAVGLVFYIKKSKSV